MKVIPVELKSRGFVKCESYIHAWAARKVLDVDDDGDELAISVWPPYNTDYIVVQVESSEIEATATVARSKSLSKLLPTIDKLVSALTEAPRT
jgi:hypothetical protein